MIIRVCAFTGKGYEIAARIMEQMERHLVEIKDSSSDLKEWTRDCFQMKTPIIFVGAVGIAVRVIAPFVQDKFGDSPVIVIDECGRFIIPILSGHIGGANVLAEELADVLHSTAVITTATDINGLFSVDVFAMDNGLNILNRSGIRDVSSKLLKNKEITMSVQDGITIFQEALPSEVRLVAADESEPVDIYISSTDSCKQNATITLSAKLYVLGVGCKKGIQYEAIAEVVDKVLKENNISLNDVSKMASVNLKEREKGLLLFSSINRIPFLTFSSDELESLKGKFSQSEFVRSVTGVSNVCERAAIAAAGEDAELIVTKQAFNGVTVAIAKRKVLLHG